MMVQDRRSDTLLTLFHIGVTLYVAISALAALVVAAAMVVILFFPSGDIASELAAAPAIALPVMLGGAATAIVTLVLAILFGLQLRHIIGTVLGGDPFDPGNADRLQRMGWYALWSTLANWIIAATAMWLGHHFHELKVTHDWAFGGIVLTATMFILARVFRHGTAMREDLEGTV